MDTYTCNICGHVHDEADQGQVWDALPDDWACPICESPKSAFESDDASAANLTATPEAGSSAAGRYLGEWERASDDVEVHMAAIHQMAETGRSISEPMRTPQTSPLWDDILIKGAQLATLPLNEDVPVTTETVIGPKAETPLVIDTPIYVTHMSFGALSREAKLAMASGSAAVRTATCSGEGGILAESMARAHKYIFEYVPNQYSVTDENLKRVDAIEIKIGQSAKPGVGGHLPGDKVTEEIAKIRGLTQGKDIVSPAHFPDIQNQEDLKKKVAWLRRKSDGKPIGIKLAAGHIEADLAVALYAEPDFVTIDGRPGGTGSAPRFIKGATSVPTVFALCRARRFLDENQATDVSLLITGGFRVSADCTKALALGADGIAIGTAAMMAIGCQQYRICNTGKCPVGITSQDPGLRDRLNVDASAERLANFLRVCTGELKDFARLTGNDDVHGLGVDDLCTTNSEISGHTPIGHV